MRIQIYKLDSVKLAPAPKNLIAHFHRYVHEVQLCLLMPTPAYSVVSCHLHLLGHAPPLDLAASE